MGAGRPTATVEPAQRRRRDGRDARSARIKMTFHDNEAPNTSAAQAQGEGVIPKARPRTPTSGSGPDSRGPPRGTDATSNGF